MLLLSFLLNISAIADDRENPSEAFEATEEAARITFQVPEHYALAADGSNAYEVSQQIIAQLKAKGIKKVWMVDYGTNQPLAITDPLVVLLKQNGIELASRQSVNESTYEELRQENDSLAIDYVDPRLATRPPSRIKLFFKKLFGTLHKKGLHLILYKEPGSQEPTVKERRQAWGLTTLKFVVSAVAMSYGIEQQGLHLLLPVILSALWFAKFDTKPDEVIGATSQGKIVHYDASNAEVRVNPLTSLAIQMGQSFLFRNLLTLAAHINAAAVFTGLMGGSFNSADAIAYKSLWQVGTAHFHTLGTVVLGTLSKVVIQIWIGDKKEKKKWSPGTINKVQNGTGIGFGAVQVLDQFPAAWWIRPLLTTTGISGLVGKIIIDREILKEHFKRNFTASSAIGCQSLLLFNNPAHNPKE